MRDKSAEVQLVIFKLGQEEYGVAIERVKRIINLSEVTPVPKANSSVEGAINLRGEIIPIINLKKRLGLPDQRYSLGARVVVVEVDKQLWGIEVDEAVEVLKLGHDAVQTPPDAVLQNENEDFVCGVIKQNDRLIGLLDLARLLDYAEFLEIESWGE